ncbi:LasU family protein [uncultured Secundilactobacillus sp.]|uniref:LasU family protein n=1 Tax=uncultured Secundilactobacillus sp. TaxID=2813935 RepID=UPI00258C4D7C|nr:LasU family protein [uncultured Secundilactobacillus sp.]
MKKTLIASPTFVLIIARVFELIDPALIPSVKNNLLAFVMTGLALYSFLVIFVSGLTLEFQGRSHAKLSQMPRGSKHLFDYLIAVLVITLIPAMYLMTNN